MCMFRYNQIEIQSFCLVLAPYNKNQFGVHLVTFQCALNTVSIEFELKWICMACEVFHTCKLYDCGYFSCGHAIQSKYVHSRRQTKARTHVFLILFIMWRWQWMHLLSRYMTHVNVYTWKKNKHKFHSLFVNIESICGQCYVTKWLLLTSNIFTTHLCFAWFTWHTHMKMENCIQYISAHICL